LRALGAGTAVAIVVGNVIGSGIFLKPGQIAADVGSFPMILAAWVFGGVICLFGALCFAELAVMLPHAGGLYVYLREAYGRPVAFLFGWSEFLFGRPASIGALSVAFVGSFGAMMSIELSVVTQVSLALLLIGLLAWVNILGVLWGGRIQVTTTLLKAGFLALLATVPFAFAMFGSSPVVWAHYQSQIAPQQTTLATRFSAAMLAVLWAYNGWHAITPVAEEVKDPRKNIPRALFGGIAILVVLYVSVNCAFHGVLSMSEMADADRPMPRRRLQEVPQRMVQKLLEPHGVDAARWGVALMSAAVMCSVFGAINSNLLNGPRVSFAMGRDEAFVRQLGRVHVVYRTPATAIAVEALMAALLVIAATVLVQTATSLQDRNIFDMLTDYTVFSASLFYMMAVLAVLVLRRKHPEWERPYKTWGYPVVPVLYLAFYSWFLYYVYLAKPFEARVGLCLVAAGLPVYGAWRAWAVRHPVDEE